MSRELIKTIQELYRPKAEGEQNFVDKHKIVKVADPAGNGDDVFSASNVKPDDRKKSRHGYEPGEDEKVYDENVLDKDIKEDLSNVKTNLKRAFTAATDIHISNNGGSKKKSNITKMGNVDEEQIDELSKKTLGSYIKKAQIKNSDDSYWKGREEEGKGVKPFSDSEHLRKNHNKEVGIKRAVDRLTKEDIIDKFIKTHIHEEFTLEEKVLLTIRDLRESNILMIMDLFESLDEENQTLLYLSLKEENGINEVLDFILGGNE